MHILLIRHGHSLGNKEKVMQGRLDFPLTEEGKIQCKLLARCLKDRRIASFYTSTLKRAKETAEILNSHHNLPLHLTKDLDEIDIGLFTGMSWTKACEEYPEIATMFYREKLWDVVPGAEKEEDIFKRIDKFLNMLLVTHKREETIVVVSHIGILQRMLKIFLHIPKTEKVFFHLKNCAISELYFQRNIVEIMKLNDTSHFLAT